MPIRSTSQVAVGAASSSVPAGARDTKKRGPWRKTTGGRALSSKWAWVDSNYRPHAYQASLDLTRPDNNPGKARIFNVSRSWPAAVGHGRTRFFVTRLVTRGRPPASPRTPSTRATESGSGAFRCRDHADFAPPRAESEGCPRRGGLWFSHPRAFSSYSLDEAGQRRPGPTSFGAFLAAALEIQASGMPRGTSRRTARTTPFPLLRGARETSENWRQSA